MELPSRLLHSCGMSELSDSPLPRLVLKEDGTPLSILLLPGAARTTGGCSPEPRTTTLESVKSNNRSFM